MKFKSKEELFHDIPSQGHTVSSKKASQTTNNFARWYYEDGLNDGAERAARGLDPYSDDFSRFCLSKYPTALRESIDCYLGRKAPLVDFPEPEASNILIGNDVVSFNIFHSDYVKCLSKELDSVLGLLFEYKHRHWKISWRIIRKS